MAQAKYLCDCKKCTYKYIGYINGKLCEWCKAIVDKEKNLTLHVENYPELYFTCDKYTDKSMQVQIKIIS